MGCRPFEDGFDLRGFLDRGEIDEYEYKTLYHADRRKKGLESPLSEPIRFERVG